VQILLEKSLCFLDTPADCFAKSSETAMTELGKVFGSPSLPVKTNLVE